MMLCDLHIHSRYGTGTQSPEDIVREARSKGISLISITDDDTMDAYEELPGAAHAHRVSYIRGVQLSARYGGRLFRPLAYDCDPENRRLQDLMAENRRFWDDLGAEIIGVLSGTHPELSVEEYNEHRKDATVGGFKYTGYLHSKGMAGDDESATKMFLQRRDEMVAIMNAAPFFPVEEVIEVIHAAGGKAIIPGGYLTIPETFRGETEALWDLGADGIEGFSASYSEEMAATARQYATERGLLITGGGDGHGTWASQEKYAIGIRKVERNDLVLGAITVYG